jgi:hypothetical protein
LYDKQINSKIKDPQMSTTDSLHHYVNIRGEEGTTNNFDGSQKKFEFYGYSHETNSISSDVFAIIYVFKSNQQGNQIAKQDIII